MCLKYQIVAIFFVISAIHGAIVSKPNSKAPDDDEFTKLEEVTAKYAEIIPTKICAYALQTTSTPDEESKDNLMKEEHAKYTDTVFPEVEPHNKVTDKQNVVNHDESLYRKDQKQHNPFTFVFDKMPAGRDESPKSNNIKDSMSNFDSEPEKERQDLIALLDYINKSYRGELSPFLF